MAATNIDTILLVSSGSDSSRPVEEFYRAPPPLSFRSEIDSNIRTLSSNGVSNKDEITGFLYVPDLDPSDPCIETSRRFIPANVTRKSNLPSSDYDVIAFAPWISANCTLSYLAAARRDSTRAFVTYPADNSSETPPEISDALWGLDDGGQWKSQNGFPVYAIPGQIGDGLISSLTHYSGNMSEVEHGRELTEVFDARGYARLYTVISTNYRAPLPSFWMLLWIVIAVVVLLSLTSSSVMYYILRRRRRSLRQRVANGEVDLEALGIKQLTVPKEIMDKMPTFIYTGMEDSPSHSTGSVMENRAEVSENHSSPTDLNSSKSPSKEKVYTQSTCPICLDDFVSHTTLVRELQPCSHIYHPECIDPFLEMKSSLCPMCKTSVLPRGYCPKNISLTTVRREYILRQEQQRMRQRGERVAVSGDDGGERQGSRRRRRIDNGVGLMGLRDWVFGRRIVPRRDNTQTRTVPVSGGVQLDQMTTTTTTTTTSTNSPEARAAAADTTQTDLSPSQYPPDGSSGPIEDGAVSSAENQDSHNGDTGREIESQGKWGRRWRSILGK